MVSLIQMIHTTEKEEERGLTGLLALDPAGVTRAT